MKQNFDEGQCVICMIITLLYCLVDFWMCNPFLKKHFTVAATLRVAGSLAKSTEVSSISSTYSVRRHTWHKLNSVPPHYANMFQTQSKLIIISATHHLLCYQLFRLGSKHLRTLFFFFTTLRYTISITLNLYYLYTIVL